ncbi:MAG: prolyl oligopeptidase family serine peptidase [candidate division Zixibacteria bacterium]|nr:prolyl oligopeptidase family serine peptidase [candidate division Zixibacteria bacterium]MBU1471190.1 prolyl oligopeptidase family serine peptidase [candidate division Zixibacteria bacterium]MBU2625771.1 prolyl oligopeptidase family serine peptidase [candidate division Zixibacteria bacterium]
MFRMITLGIVILLLLIPSAITALGSDKVESILTEIDPWVTTDTTKILAYIDSTEAVTIQMLESSKFWEPTMTDLSFLLGIDLVTDPQIDNTGRIYFQMRITGESQAIFYMDGPMGWPIQFTPNNWTDEGIIISGFSVHPSGDFVLVTVNVFGDEMHDIWRFERNGQFKPLLQSRTERYSGLIFDEDNPDQFYLYIQTDQMRIGRYTMSTAKLDTIYSEPGAFYPLDYYKSKLAFLRYISFSETQLAMLDLSSGKVTDLSDTTLVWGAGFTDDGKMITLTSAKSNDDEFMKFCMLDPAKPKEFKVIYDPKKETEDFTFIRKKGVVVTALNLDGYSEMAAFDMTGKVIPVPQPKIGVASAISSNDLGKVVFGYSSPTTPPTAFSFALGDTGLKQIGKVSTFGFDFSGIEVQVIRYKSEDGTEIPALLYKPVSAKMDGSNPAIVNYHGGPPGQSRPYFQRNIAFALSKGFVMMFPNVRGSTGYGPAYERADNLEGRFASLLDCEAALDYLIDNGYSRPDKIAVWGASYGGYIVDWLTTTCPDKLACGVSDVGVSDVDWTNTHSKNQAFSAGWEREMGPVGSDLTHKLTPIFKAENLTKPILVTAGFNDPRVPPSDPRRFAYVLSRLGKPVWYYEETEAGHGGSFKKQIIFDLTKSYTFTMEHLMK